MLNLAHRRHTGKYLPHHHTSYHGLFLVLLVVGIALFSISRAANAADMTVSVKIPAPIPTVPATITAPTEGEEFDDPDITVEGTCEVMTPDIIIEIWSNGNFIGSGPCQSSDASYSVNVTLYPGWNALVAKSINITDDYGPDSTTVNVKYNAPIPPPPPPPTPSPSPPPSTGGTTKPPTGGTDTPGVCTPGGQLRIASEQTHLIFGRSDAAKWDIAVTGGCAPYFATIDWGDGKQSKVTIEDNDIHTYFHRYTAPKSFIATIIIEDSGSGATRFSVAATTSTQPELFGGGVTDENGWPWNFPFFQTTEGLMVLLYLVYLLMLALFAAAWYDAYVHHLRFVGFHVFPPPPPGVKKRGFHNDRNHYGGRR
jgi:hypothetical protein